MKHLAITAVAAVFLAFMASANAHVPSRCSKHVDEHIRVMTQIIRSNTQAKARALKTQQDFVDALVKSKEQLTELINANTHFVACVAKK